MYMYYIFDYHTNGFSIVFLDLIYIISIIFGIFIIISKNPIVSVLYLIGLFSTIACYLIFLGINFIGLSYLLVYIGAVSILFLFILMLINIRISELLSDTNNNIFLAIIITIAFSYPINNALPGLYKWVNLHNNLDWKQEKINYSTSKDWESTLVDTSHITSIGNIMYTSYSIWLIITSIILLLAMVGAIVITIKQPSLYYTKQ